jgi:hypothetical protein
MKNKRIQGRTFGYKTDEIIQGWGEFHDKGKQNLSSFVNFIMTIKSRTVRWRCM